MDFKIEEVVPMFIKPEDLHLYESVKFIDARDPKAYAEGHLKNAINYMKHPKVSTLEGGLEALLLTEGGAQLITKEPPTIIPCQYDGQDNNITDCIMATRDDVLEIINNKPSGTWLLDVRDAIEWNGLSSSPYGINFTPRKGRLPNSIWIEWYKFHELDYNKGIFKSKSNEQIQALLKEKGIQNNDKIIVYCFKGSRAAVALMKMNQAGYTNVKNYFASWNEWSRDPQLPIDDKILDEKV
ncbi:unnamed protein product [Rotaria sordida]|uniref:Rhodanese domain-containing protein n=1 Tax=Rotaria sordida TaxID=392033 RepID=A0A819W8E5_9BILA|nr:unnamed protein product [Rotaria sordida]CAF4120214.1 unnamed protein product [Rotaria sordida]